MSIRRLVIQISVTAVMLAVVNVVLQRLSLNSIPLQLLRAAESAEPATDLFLGDSLIADGIDERVFASTDTHCRPLNLGFRSSSPVEHFLLYRRQHKHRNAAVYYGYIHTGLTDPAEGSWSSLVGNRTMSYDVDPDIAVKFYEADSPWFAAVFPIVAKIPMLAKRYTIWARVERMRRLMGEIGLPKTYLALSRRTVEFSSLESRLRDFAIRCESSGDFSLNGPISGIVQQAKLWGNDVYIIEMPLPSAHRNLYYTRPEWLTYRSHVLQLIQDAGGVYVPAADWVDDEGFSDSSHLNASGARTFSNRLGDWIRQRS